MKDQSSQDADDANDLLGNLFDDEVAGHRSYNSDTTNAMFDFDNDLHSTTGLAAAAIDDQFIADADAVEMAKNTFLDDAVKAWAYWLKWAFGYAGYEPFLYGDYDDTGNYSQPFHNNEFYSGPAGGISTNAGGNPNPSGFGYGGVGGVDYIYANEHTGLVHGTETGPDPAYYNQSILSPKDELVALLDGYKSTTGQGYW